jgi:hypothetical protein
MLGGVLEFRFAEGNAIAASDHMAPLGASNPGAITCLDNDTAGQGWLSTNDIFGDAAGALPLPVSSSDAKSMMAGDAASRTAFSVPASGIDLGFVWDTAHATAILRALQHADTGLTS